VARDRKRSRQRRPRPIREQASVSSPGRVLREDLPGELEHMGDVDEFDAALVRGASGVPLESSGLEPGGEVAEHESEAGDGDGSAAVEQAFGREGAPARRATAPGENRVVAFLRASWAELQRVQWPDRQQVSQATAVVIGFVAVMGLYFGIADWAAEKIVNFII
jgi:preprotein translocase subunit SecE